MRIAFCTPFKPVYHSSISGDVTIARDLFHTLKRFGHELIPVEYFPAKQIYWKPHKWAAAKAAMDNMIAQSRDADCWFTYGTYYKVPDIFGPTVSKQHDIPYFLYQASYAENRANHIKTWPGYMLNKRAMLTATHIFCNRVNDMETCRKILPKHKFSYISPGLPNGMFGRKRGARDWWRNRWNVGDSTVVMTAAMMRHGVKTEGIRWVIASCADLIVRGHDIKLMVAGDGPKRRELEAMARLRLGDRVEFLGLVDRLELPDVFSAGDVFAFPGLEESVGMVYLEAQQCGLPVVATSDEGAPYVVKDGYSGLITPVDKEEFTFGLRRLVEDKEYRESLGKQAIEYVRKHHIADTNLHAMVKTMERLTGPKDVI
ncbi:glycosyltransferase family 4 protein [Pseudodesulfovibrio sp. zrk46]|uniref:glycosyltransferase family 4 protein n=1 Tax=Pseudodesulfovibrio sp. zrk46 TaxID=2725288 RepID=UPI001449723F|nr:glycosyltransferase family 4 protein [Pseudodesulfovibrio sp. zrk46]QJB55991.1 glycosyltransferase family 4 protein [Pseudodesulfovibrio sp. zrk46]